MWSNCHLSHNSCSCIVAYMSLVYNHWSMVEVTLTSTSYWNCGITKKSTNYGHFIWKNKHGSHTISVNSSRQKQYAIHQASKSKHKHSILNTTSLECSWSVWHVSEILLYIQVCLDFNESWLDIMYLLHQIILTWTNSAWIKINITGTCRLIFHDDIATKIM